MLRRLLFSLLVICSFLSCDRYLGHRGIYNEGKIVYKITYLDYGKSSMNPALLPTKMILEFNQDSCVNSIDGFMGFFHLGNITYFKTKSCSTLLTVLDKNYAFEGDKNELMCCFECMDDMKIKKDTATKIFAGLKSKKAIISFDNSDETFAIYYTDEINLSHPNSTNPYKKINGVLTQFRLRMGPYYMLFTAEEFTPGALLNSSLRVPENTQRVTREELTYILNKLME
jgi:hypothetical protein